VNLSVRALAVYAGAAHPLIWTSVFSADALLAGTALATVSLEERVLRKLVLPALVVAALACVALGWMRPVHEVALDQVAVYAVVAVGSVSLCLACLYIPWFRWLGAAPMRYLGKVSYGLYVFHLLGIAVGTRVARWVGVGEWFALFLLSLVATVIMAATSYELLEKRFLVLKRAFETVHSRPP
jgi:peptidoglycan/LPS O-acetylase OafA/YrhL